MLPKFTRDAIFYKMKKRGVTQTELAKTLGVARPTLCSILNGKYTSAKHEETLLKWYKEK
jgi:transcriptional regulator with XRE-family HTH domain